MFSQLRQAVESLAAPVRDNSSEQQAETVARRPVDALARRSSSPLSSNQLADSARSNLRKSIAVQRTGSPVQGNGPKGSSVNSPRERAKTNLEDRLRASFTIGEASNETSPDLSARASPSPVPAAYADPISPHSVPLPDSPAVTALPDPEGPSAISLTPPDVITESTSSLQASRETDDPPLVHIDEHAETSIEPIKDDSGPNSDELPPTQKSSPSSPQTSPGPSIPVEFSHTLSLDSPQRPSNEVLTKNTEILTNLESREAALRVEELQERLKQVEQRFSDVSTAFKRLQTEKNTADKVLQEYTPLESVGDAVAFRNYLENTNTKHAMFQEDIKNLTTRLEEQDIRTAEIHESHRNELASHTGSIEQMKTELREEQSRMSASRDSSRLVEENATKLTEEVTRLRGEMEKHKTQAKEEEEKRVKAISLLKTVRQKLVKAEKDKEDALKEIGSIREREKVDREREQLEKTKLQKEIETINTERENADAGLRAQFDKEVANMKERYQKEYSNLMNQFENQTNSMKVTHSTDLSSKNAHIATLEESLRKSTRERDTFFDSLQLRQAELESSQSHLESLQSQNTELQYQLREANERNLLLKEDITEAQREQEIRTREPSTSTAEVARLLSASEAKYEFKLSESRAKIASLEKDRNDVEADWSRKLRDKVRESEDLKRSMESAKKTREKHDEVVLELKALTTQLQDENGLLHSQLTELQYYKDQTQAVEDTARIQEAELNTKISVLEQQIGEFKTREAQLRLSNKTLREELRKVQSSAALLERQRNPGVGYWTSRTSEAASESSESRPSVSSDHTSRAGSPAPTSPVSSKNEEEVNLEYLRNVIFQFLEHKEMRPNLVKVLSIILHFTPQETRRLIAKV